MDQPQSESLSLSACYTYLVLYLLRPSAGAIALFGFPLTCHYAPISSPFDFFSYILGLSVLSPRPMLSPSCVVLYRRRPFRLDVMSQQASTHRRLGPAAPPSPSIHVSSRNRQRLMALREHFLSLSYFSIAFSYALVFTVLLPTLLSPHFLLVFIQLPPPLPTFFFFVFLALYLRLALCKSSFSRWVFGGAQWHSPAAVQSDSVAPVAQPVLGL